MPPTYADALARWTAGITKLPMPDVLRAALQAGALETEAR